MNIIITGTSKGIGFALAKTLVKAGHNVWGLSRPRSKNMESNFLEELATINYKHSFCDISSMSAIKKFHEEILLANFFPDIIYLNAAVEYEEVAFSINKENLAKMIDTNLKGSLVLVSYFMKEFMQRNKGKFVAISSLFDQWPDANSPIYSASKAGLLMAFRGFKLRFKDTAVQFQCVSLGPIHTSVSYTHLTLPTICSV